MRLTVFPCEGTAEKLDAAQALREPTQPVPGGDGRVGERQAFVGARGTDELAGRVRILSPSPGLPAETESSWTSP
ncbi:hypothetical protein [Streptomyces sp. NPDC048106]|uniref:hypothetical protein n=1 Tax=Streptomyces sp. NPDC048106 TaxID=3155750 RepID=UPI00345616D1